MFKRIGLGAIYTFLITWVVVVLLPLMYMFMSSFRSDGEIMENPWAIPNKLYLENYLNAWFGTGNTSFGTYFLNSVIVTGGTLALLTFVALLAGYALARYPFPGNKVVYGLTIGLIAIPVHALLVPVFIFMEDLSLTNTLIGIILIYSTFWLPLSIVLMRSYFETIPSAVEEAARIDGCTEIGIFWHIGLPMAKGSVATLIIINIVGIWSELMFANVLLSEPSVRTLPVGIMQFMGGMYGGSVGTLFAALSIATVPLLIVYFIFQKQIVKGMAMGAVK